MNSHFFLICFGLLVCYATLRTIRRGWLRVLLVFFLIMCIVKVTLDDFFPEPVYVAQQGVPTVSTANAQGFLAPKLAALEDDRCIVSHLADTPLGPIAYMLQAHQFLRAYKDAQGASAVNGGGANLAAVTQAVNTTFGSDQAPAGPPSLCDTFMAWLQNQAQGQIQNAVHGQVSDDQ